MPNKGYKQSKAHRLKIGKARTGKAHDPRARRAISEGMKYRYARVKIALSLYTPPKQVRKKGSYTEPIPTPIPPSASDIASDHLQRWGLYSLNEEGQYYYKREHTETLDGCYRLVQDLDLVLPLWTYVKSAREEKDLFMPIRIPIAAVPTLGARWQKFVLKKKEKKRR